MAENPTRNAVLTIGGFLLIVATGALVYYYAPEEAQVQAEAPVSLSEQIRKGQAPVPPFSTSTKEKLERSEGFDVLVSYTDTGFEPGAVSLLQGKTIRFTNNSSEKLWVASEGRRYPKNSSDCGQSDLDSCVALEPLDFYEFTMDVAGTWDVVNNINKAHSLTISVETQE